MALLNPAAVAAQTQIFTITPNDKLIGTTTITIPTRQKIARLLSEWIPYPPRVEISTLGESAVLMGALAVGLRSALDNVFVNRPTAATR